MVGLTAIFWIFVLLFSLIGLMRGWAKELLVTFAMILALFIASVIERFLPFIPATLEAGGSGTPLFWMRTLILIILVFFGYQTPGLPKLAGSGRFARERLQDSLLGLFLGAINGFLVVGTIWYYLDQAGYPFPLISAPDPNSEIGRSALRLIAVLPPNFMAPPTIYFAVAVAFVFVLVVFI
jgi:uncharacterized membrane protein required for colicin V production